MSLPKAHTHKDLHQTLNTFTRNSSCEYSYATTTPLLSYIPQQFEVELTLKNHKPEDVPKIKSMMDTIAICLADMEYGLFNLVETPTKDKLKGYFVASPTLTQAVTTHKGKYTLTLFIAHLKENGWDSHQAQSLRDITRYLSGGNLDPTAKNYYCSWFKAYLVTQIEKQCSRIVDVPHWVMDYLMNSSTPTELIALEKKVFDQLLTYRELFVARKKAFKTPSSYHQFIKQHCSL